MEKNEVKKALYKQKPFAKLITKEDGKSIYECNLLDGQKITFKIPHNEANGFSEVMEAQLLIRWVNI